VAPDDPLAHTPSVAECPPPLGVAHSPDTPDRNPLLPATQSLDAPAPAALVDQDRFPEPELAAYAGSVMARSGPGP
jgi:hypothetical protein